MAVNIFMTLHTLQNNYWQAGILPGTGASIAFGRVRKNSTWIDVLRPTTEADYGNSSNCSSFIMLPWCNRIKDGLLRFGGHEYQLRTAKDDGTARHGDVRGRAWRIDEADESYIRMSIRSDDYPDMNWPFKFSAAAVYTLDDDRFNWTLTLKNEDTRPMPAGFGYHPYFVRPQDNVPILQITCEKQFKLDKYLAVGSPVPLMSALDFRQTRPLGDGEFNDLLTARWNKIAALIVYPLHGIGLAMYADHLFEHILLFTPFGKPFFAVEPMTNASDGFNLYENGIPGSGVFVLHPEEEKTGKVSLSMQVPD
jgi:aldose 1-epimerase